MRAVRPRPKPPLASQKAKRENPFAETSKLKSEIDELVCRLYDFTEEEIAIVEGKV